MTPRDALERAVYLLDRGLAPSAKVRAFQRAIEVVDQLDPAEVEQRTANGTLQELAGIGPATGGVIADAVAGRPSEYLDRLDRESEISPGDGADLLAALRGDCHSHSTWSDGGASIAAMARTAQSLGHDYLVMTDHSPRLTIAHGLNRERLKRNSTRSRPSTWRWPRFASSPVSRSTSSTTAVSTRTPTCWSASTWSWPVHTPSWRCPATP